MEKSKLIIIEGAQGSGKTTLANFLRENMASANLYRLSGQKEKGSLGQKRSAIMYFALLNYLKQMEQVPMDLIFDRTFFTEEVYARLGWKDYTFTDIYNQLLEQCENLNYEIYLIILYLEDTNLYQKRLERESHHKYQDFSVENSILQQKKYLELAKELQERKMNVIKLAMDDFNTSYEKIKKILKINQVKK